MSVLAMVDLSLRILSEFITNLLVKSFDYGICKSSRRLDGQVVVITGASAGIGKALTLLMAQRGAKIVMAVRSEKKAEEVIKDIKAKVPNVDIEIVHLELASLNSVRQCAETIKAKYDRVDVLVNNGGLWVQEEERTEDGHEIHFGVNYLAHFLLTLLLLPAIKKSKNGKVINVSSVAHRFSSLDMDDLQMKKSYTPMELYGKSKLAQVLFTRELAARCPTIKTYAVHPGLVKTDITRDQEQPKTRIGLKLQNLLLKTPEEGAQTIVHCALDEKADQESGLYYMDCKSVTPSKEALDTQKGKALWKKSLAILGLQEDDLNN